MSFSPIHHASEMIHEAAPTDSEAIKLFTLNADDVRIALVEGQSYRYPINDCIVEIWKEGSRVYDLVV